MSGLVVSAASLALAPALHALALRADEERRALAPTVEVLAGLGIFGAASRPALERLARAARPVTIEPGARVFAEGDRADDLYVVVEGTLVVTSTGESGGAPTEVSRLAAGDWFGEIGLLHRRSRTATVTAATGARLLAIAGDVFVDAVTGSEPLPDPLRRTMALRLARTHPSLSEAV